MFVQLRNFLVPILNRMADREYEYKTRSQQKRVIAALNDMPRRLAEMRAERKFLKAERVRGAEAIALIDLNNNLRRVKAQAEAEITARQKQAAKAARKQARIEAKAAKRAAKADSNTGEFGQVKTFKMTLPADPVIDVPPSGTKV